MIRKHLILTVVVLLLSALLLCGCAPEISIDDTTILTKTGTVTDRAMASEGTGKIWDKSYPYLGIEFEDGSELCIWNKDEIDISEHIGIGSVVEVTYGLQKSTDHWILIDIKEVE